MSAEEILSLVKRSPGELGFVYSSKTYEDYLKTYTDAKFPAESAVYTEEEFKVLKDYFGDEE